MVTVSSGIGGTGGALSDVEYTGGTDIEDLYTEVFRLVRRRGPDSGNEPEQKRESCSGIGNWHVMLGELPVNTSGPVGNCEAAVPGLCAWSVGSPLHTETGRSLDTCSGRWQDHFVLSEVDDGLLIAGRALTPLRRFKTTIQKGQRYICGWVVENGLYPW